MTGTEELIDMPFIEGNMVSLYPINVDHFSLYCKWVNFPECRISNGKKFPQTLEEIKKYFEPKEERIKEVIHFEIRHKREKKPIGLTGFNSINYYSRKGILSMIFGEKLYKTEDIAIETNKLILNYGFEELNLHKIVLNILALDDFSIKIVETLGLIKELTLKDEVYFQGKRIDLLKYFILKRDWRNL